MIKIEQTTPSSVAATLASQGIVTGQKPENDGRHEANFDFFNAVGNSAFVLAIRKRLRC
jgi:hypothetical protein